MRLPDLAVILRTEGVDVREVGAWRTHVRPGIFAPVGVIVHHTADKGRGDSGLNVLRHGRDDLNGPLCNLSPREDGTVVLLSAGRTNHAGAGSQAVLDRVRADLAPTWTGADGPVGNGLFYGIEVDNDGLGQDYPVRQIAATVACCAAICRAHGWSASRVILHAEWTKRKADWSAMPGSELRALVAARLRETTPDNPVIPATEVPLMLTVWAPGRPYCLLTGGRLFALEDNEQGAAYEATGIRRATLTPEQWDDLDRASKHLASKGA